MAPRSAVTSASPRNLKRLASRQAAVAALAGVVLLLTSAAALALTGDLTQPAGTAGCVSEDGSGPCADGRGLYEATDAAVSPDGKNVYVASFNGHSVARLNRNTTSGALTQPAGTAGCVSADGSGPCADGHGLSYPTGVAVSPDNKSVYVTSYYGGVARFNRNTTTGAITQPAGTAGCVSEDGSGPCADGRGLTGATGVDVSPDNKSVYVASTLSDTVARFNRNTTSGVITQPTGAAGCVGVMGGCAGAWLDAPMGLDVSPDGKSVYVASYLNKAVVRLNRNTTTGSIAQAPGTAGCISDDGSSGVCVDGHALYGPHDVAVTPDNKSVYEADYGSNALVRFNRNPANGAITQPAGVAGCVSEDGSGPCADGHGLKAEFGLAVSPDNKSVYAASNLSNAVARFNRNTTSGAISQPAGTAGCVSEDGSGPCANGHGLFNPHNLAVSADGKSLYVASYSSSALVRFNRAP